jgi:hypothetical protein
MIERRRKPRDRVRIGATVVIHDGVVRIPAEVRDTSPFGAKIALSTPHKVPRRFYILVGHRIEVCRLIWQDEDMLGLEYDD